MDSHHKGPVMRKPFPYHDVFMLYDQPTIGRAWYKDIRVWFEYFAIDEIN